MANLGTVFNEAEEGWTRYDSEHIALKYEDDWKWSSNPAYYGGNRMAVSKDSLSSKVKFDFEGDSIRLISSLYPGYSDSLIFKIDGKEHPFSQAMQGTTNRALCFELNNIEKGRHTVEIYKVKSGTYSEDFFIDAIDIKKPSRLYHIDEVSNINELDIGKRIACNYKVFTQNKIGTFSKLGGYNENVKCLKKEPVALPDGMFYFIMVDEINKKKKLIADRNIQNYISWQTINEAGFVFGSTYSILDEDGLISTIPKMSSYTLGDVNVSASSEQDPCWQAFNKNEFILEDTDNRNYWYTGSKSMTVEGHWLKVDYGTLTKIDSYKIAAVKNTGYGTYAPKDWVIEGSNDDSTWIILDKKEDFIFSSAGNAETFNLLNSGEFRYYRIRITEGAHISGYTIISYLQFYSEPKKNTYDYYLKLLSGGTAGSNTAPATDKDNEWDKYIVNSSLNGLIVPGDDNVWNWGVEQSSWTSTTGVISNVHKVVRGRKGYSQEEYFYTNNNGTRNEGVDYYCSYRPVLEIENKVSYKHILYKDGEYGYKNPRGKEYIRKTPKNMTSNTSIEGKAIASSIFSDDFDAYKLFDEKIDQATGSWASLVSNVTTKQWVGFIFNNPESINKVMIRARNDSGVHGRSLRNFMIQAQSNNGSWINLHEEKDIPNWGVGEKREYTFNNNNKYRAYRVLGLETTDAGKLIFGLSELEFLYGEDEFVSLGTSIPTDEQFEQFGVEDLTEWLPYINEIQGEKKIITKASKPLVALNLEYIPEPQFIKQKDSISINKELLETLTINEGQTKGNIRVAAQFPDVDSYSYVYKDSMWSKIDTADVNVFSENGNTIDEMNAADWSTSPLLEKVRFIYSMKMNSVSDSVILSSIDIQLKGLTNNTPKIQNILGEIKAYTLNGYMNKMEEANSLNFAKLEFKSDSIMKAKENNMHEMIVDVLNEDTLITYSSDKPTNEETITAVDVVEVEGGYTMSIPIEDNVEIKSVP